MQTLFRGNSLASKIMTFCFKVYGATYLQKLLDPLLRVIITSSDWQHVSFEVDPTRLEPSESLEENQRNLLQMTEKFFHAIISSSSEFPSQLRSVCHCLYQATCHSLLNKATVKERKENKKSRKCTLHLCSEEEAQWGHAHTGAHCANVTWVYCLLLTWPSCERKKVMIAIIIFFLRISFVHSITCIHF